MLKNTACCPNGYLFEQTFQINYNQLQPVVVYFPENEIRRACLQFVPNPLG
jgi:hypothetical protein